MIFFDRACSPSLMIHLGSLKVSNSSNYVSIISERKNSSIFSSLPPLPSLLLTAFLFPYLQCMADTRLANAIPYAMTHCSKAIEIFQTRISLFWQLYFFSADQWSHYGTQLRNLNFFKSFWRKVSKKHIIRQESSKRKWNMVFETFLLKRFEKIDISQLFGPLDKHPCTMYIIHCTIAPGALVSLFYIIPLIQFCAKWKIQPLRRLMLSCYLHIMFV